MTLEHSLDLSKSRICYHNSSLCLSTGFHVKKLFVYVPDIAGVRIPSPIIMEVPSRTNSNKRVFKDDFFSNVSFMFKALFSSGVGSLSLKLEMCSSAGWRFGSIFTFAYLQISEYSANVPPTVETLLYKNWDLQCLKWTKISNS